MAKFQGMAQGRNLRVMVANVTRSMTAATEIMRLPRGAQILGFVLSGTASNAGTTATLAVGNTSAATEYVNTANVLAAGVGNGVNLLSGVASGVGSVQKTPGDDINSEKYSVYVKYAETGTASAAGAWKLWVLYTDGGFEFNALA